ncbi:MAG: flippase [Clostridium sp.]|uniref:flippase n=1 Tax=Clostridium sp. TaxID=1506 RepID=UPI0039958C38
MHCMRSLMSDVKKNFSYNIIFQIFTIAMPLITAPYLSRILGASGVGIYSYYFTIANYFVYFAMLGVSNYGTRSIAKSNDKDRDKAFWNIYGVQIIASLIVFCVYILYVINTKNENRVIPLIQSIFVLSAAFDINWYFFGTEKFKLTTIRNVIIKVSALIAIFIFIKDKNDIWLYTLIMASSYLLSQMIMWIYLFKEIKFIKPNFNEMIHHIKPMLILFIPIIAITLYKMMDKIMLGNMTNMDQVGFYENGEKIIRIPALIITALGTAMLPRMTSLNAAGEKNKFYKYIEISIEFAEFISIAVVFGLSSVSEVFVPIYFGKDFTPVISIISMLSISLIFSSWANVIRTQYLIPLSKDRDYVISVFLGAITNVIINIILIPKLLAIGAVIGTIFAEAIVSIYQTFAVRKELNINLYFKSIVFYFIPGFIMFMSIKLILRFLSFNIISLFFIIMLGACIYISICAWYWYLTKSPMFNILKKTFNKVRR